MFHTENRSKNTLIIIIIIIIINISSTHSPGVAGGTGALSWSLNAR